MNVMTLGICAVLELRTLYVYHALDHNLKRQYRDDYMLLSRYRSFERSRSKPAVHAATNIVVPILLATFILIDTTTSDGDRINKFAEYCMPYIVDALSLTEPIWLMLFRWAKLFRTG